MNNEVDEVDNYDYDYDYDYDYNNDNDDNETFNNQINKALQMSLKDANLQTSYLNMIFEQYLGADDELKNIILDDLSQDELNDLLSMIETQNDISKKLISDNERQMLIQLQDMEYNESLKNDIMKGQMKDEMKGEKINIDEMKGEKNDIDEKINIDEMKDIDEKNDIDEIRKKRLEFYNKK